MRKHRRLAQIISLATFGLAAVLVQAQSATCQDELPKCDEARLDGSIDWFPIMEQWEFEYADKAHRQ